MPVWAMVFLFFMWFMVDSASKAHFSSTNVLPSRLEKLRKKSSMGAYAPKVSKGRSQTSFVFMPFGRARRREISCYNEKIVCFFRQPYLTAFPNRSLA